MLLVKLSIKWYKGCVEGKPLGWVLTPGRLGSFRHCPRRPHPRVGGFGVCKEAWMCLWKDFILLMLIKPFLSRILPWLSAAPAARPCSCRSQIWNGNHILPPVPQGFSPPSHSCHRAQEGSDTFLLPDPHSWMLQSSPAPSLPPGSIRHLTMDFPLQKSEFFFWKGVPTLALLSLTQPGPFPWETQTLSG